MYPKRELNLKNDIVFKTFFSRKGNEEFLIDFLNALLKIDIKKIKINEEVDLERLSVQEKGGRLDILAELNDGIIVNIELQMRNEANIEERTMFYSSKVLSQVTERGTDYRNLKQIIMINILNYKMLECEEYISKTAIVLDKHRDYKILNGMQWYFIELPKFRKSHPDMNEKINQWLALIDDEKELVKMAETKNKVIGKAKVEIHHLTGDEKVKRLEWLREKWEMDRISAENYARSQGEKLGEIRGRTEGRAEGRAEGKIEIAKEMLRKGMPKELIEEITKLSKEEIEKLM